MHKSKLIPFLLFFFFSITFAQQKDTIYGKVKSVREQLHFLDNERQNMKLYSTEGEYGHHGFSNADFTNNRFHSLWYNTPWVHYSNYYKEFNEIGKKTYEIWFYKDGDTVRTYRYRYDKQNNLTQTKSIYGLDDYTCRNYTYDNENNVSSSIYYVSDDPNLYSYTTYVRDSLSNLIQHKSFGEFGEEDYWKYAYDKKNRKISKSIHKPYIYFNDGTTIRAIRDSVGLDKICEKYFYDSNNNLVETQYYYYHSSNNLPSKLYRKVKNEYNKGLLKKVIHIRDTIISYDEYQYDNQKRKIKETVTSIKYPEINRSSQYFYDINNNIIKLIYTKDNKPITIKFEYEFDKQNNWTKQVKLVNEEKLFVWTREINYYE